MKKIKEALEAYQKFNSVRNDFDAYLYALGAWALSGEPKPNPTDYGISPPIKPCECHPHDKVYYGCRCQQ
jgi:hypothetical protein